MIRLAKRAVINAARIAGYDVYRREPAPVITGVEAEEQTDYQLLMAQQELMANLADLDPPFAPIMQSVKPYTMTSIPRLFDLYKSVEYLVKARIPGDLVECGVWRGGSVMLMAQTLLALGDTSRTLFLFDTFEGHPKPDAEKDRDLWGKSAFGEWLSRRTGDETTDWGKVSVDEVRANMASTGYPMDKVVCVKGKVEDTAAMNCPACLALIRIDTDWYASTKTALGTFWPTLSRNGFLIIDDYGHYRGQRQAVDEFFAEGAVKLTRIDYACRTVQKTP